MAAGLDEAAFLAAAPGRRGLNAALGGTPPVEHYLICSRQDRQAAAGVYYGFYDTQLTAHPSGDWATLVGNRAIVYYVDPDLALQFYFPEQPTKVFFLKLASRLPMLVERQAIWLRVERLR